VDERGLPNIRTVLVRERSLDGFVFYTNLQSKKAHELALLNKAALLFYWKSLGRQIRIRGTATLVDNKQADAYFDQRPLESRIGAHASLQSCPLTTRADLEESFEIFKKNFLNKPIPRPSHWSGFRITPVQIEFWQAGAHRLHDRLLYDLEPDGKNWRRTLLYP
jgi:pyridoxamine 5'-phosphate oxidase